MERCSDDAERHRVDPNVRRGQFHRQAAGRGDTGTLRKGGEDRGDSGQSVFDQARGDLDDVAAALLFHRWHSDLRGEENTVEIGRHLPIKFFGDFLDRARAPDSRVVDQSITRPKLLMAVSTTFLAIAGSPTSPGTVM
jgi:hypothetical protein